MIMKKLFLFIGAFLMLTTFGFAQVQNTSVKYVQKQGMNQLFMAPNSGVASHFDFSNNQAKVDAEAYGGNTTSFLYGSIVVADGTYAETGEIATDPFPMAEEFADGIVYRVDNGGGFYSVDPDDGTATTLGALSGFTGTPTGLAYDWGNGIMYVMMLDGDNAPNLFTLDMTTYALTAIGSVGTGMIIAMDFAADGFLYGPAIDDDNLYKIDPATGVTTLIGAIGVDLNYGQDVSFDFNTGLLYTVSCGGAYSYGTYDLTTGALTEIFDFVDQQFGTLVICNIPADPTAPAASTDLLVTQDGMGGLTVDVSWTNPALDVAGDPLAELTLIELFINDETPAEYSNNSPIIDGDESESVTVPSAGSYTFTVIGTNSTGEGLPTSVTVWIGVNIPALLDDVIENTTLDVTPETQAVAIGADALVNAVVTYPDVVDADLEDYYSDAIVNLGAALADPVDLSIIYTLNENAPVDLGTFTIPAGTSEIYLSDVIGIPRPLLTTCEGLSFDWALTISGLGVGLYDVVVTAVTNTAAEFGTDDVVLATDNAQILSGDMITYDFEDGMPDGFTIIDGECGWMFGPDGGSQYFPIADHTSYAYVNDDACNGDMSDVWMKLHPVDYTGVAAPFMQFENVRYYDIFTIKASTNGSDWVDVVVLSSDAISEWTTETIDLSAYAEAPMVYLAFHYNDNGEWGYGWAVDDILMNGVLADLTGLEDNMLNEVNLYPNPTTGIVNISNVNGATISIVNMIGQTVYSTVATSDTFTIDASVWEQGTYIVRIANNDEVMVKKFNLMK